MTLFSSVFAVPHASLSGCSSARQAKLNFATPYVLLTHNRRFFEMCAFHGFQYLLFGIIDVYRVKQ